MRQSSRAFLSLLALSGLVVSTWASPARAADCTSDQDCEAGSKCVKGVSVPGCDPSAPDGCPEPTPVEEEVGTCEVQPIECTADPSVCPEYLTCLENQDGACWANSDGTTGCTEPDPDAPRYCGFQQTTCNVDGDCPREFACVEIESGCPLKGECTPQTIKQCQPRQIECATDAECPSDWSCIEVTSGGGCSASGSAGSPTGTGSTGTGSIGVGGADSGGSTTDPSEPAPDLPTTEEPTTEEPTPTGACEETVTTAHYCAPKNLITYGYGYDLSADGSISQESGSANGSDDDASGAPKSPEAPHEKAEDKGGCSVAPMLGGSGGMFAPLMLLAPLAARIGRRRRAS